MDSDSSSEGASLLPVSASSSSSASTSPLPRRRRRGRCFWIGALLAGLLALIATLALSTVLSPALADASASALPAAAASAARDAPSPVGCGPPGFNAERRLTDLAGVEEEANALLADIRPLAAMPSAMRRVRMLRAPAAGIGAVLVGGSGSGKSALASGVAAQLRAAHSPAAAVRTVWLDCRSLRGSSIVAVRRRLAAAWSATLARAPALLVLDDADLVMPAPSGEGHGPESESFIACLPLHRNSGFLTNASESTHHVRLPPPAPARRAPSR